MSHPRLVALLAELSSASGDLDWRGYQKEMAELAREPLDEPDRVTLLRTRDAIFDAVERQFDEASLVQFRNARAGEYRLFLTLEAMDGENVNPVKLARVTAREVEAGRMDASDDFRELAAAGAAVIGEPSPRKQGLFGRLFGR